jgi:hypothetical protein
MRSRLLTAFAGFLVGAVVVGGVAVATTQSPGSVTACRTSNGVLKLASARGGCPRGAKKVTLNERGKTGARGPQGPGAQASLAAPAAGASATGKAVKIAGTPVTVTASCDSGDAILTVASSSAYQLDGPDYSDASSGASATFQYAGISPTGIGTGSGVLHLGGPSGSSVITLTPGTSGTGGGTIEANLLGSAGSTLFAISVHERVYALGNTCLAEAEVTPT